MHRYINTLLLLPLLLKVTAIVATDWSQWLSRILQGASNALSQAAHYSAAMTPLHTQLLPFGSAMATHSILWLAACILMWQSRGSALAGAGVGPFLLLMQALVDSLTAQASLVCKPFFLIRSLHFANVMF